MRQNQEQPNQQDPFLRIVLATLQDKANVEQVLYDPVEFSIKHAHNGRELVLMLYPSGRAHL